MVELSAKSPCAGGLPVHVGSLTLTEVTYPHITSVTAKHGRTANLSELLKSTHGMALPKPNRATGKSDARAIWFGPDQAMLMGPEPNGSLTSEATVVDQSDAWAVVRIEGTGAEDVLARLIPIDLRSRTFKRGHTARTLLQHMTVSVTRVGDQAFQIMAFRSMARTLVHDLQRAMESCAARG